MMSSEEYRCPAIDRTSPPAATWRREELHSPAEVGRVLRTVAAELRARGYPPKDVFAVRLCLHEAIGNALRHGNGSDPGKRVRVQYQITAGRVVVEVADEGAGFDPTSLPDFWAADNRERPRGRGIVLMRAYMTWVRFNARGNEVAMCRMRSSAGRPG